ncbi:hypothetical protein Taro_008824 [Colocasia esculenta]|uniref:Uncharacterized protein n=1 Tax=Colocasia esculenta TaxID=4460 RepID=A0A843TYD9_COLES|nr:hypothetical protein [Colocasia esculenta]
MLIRDRAFELHSLQDAAHGINNRTLKNLQRANNSLHPSRTSGLPNLPEHEDTSREHKHRSG